MTRWLRAATGGVILCLLMQLLGFVGACEELRDSTVRLHVLAHSDSDADQALKLKVRDAVTAAAAQGRTVVRGASRLKIKESDRLSTVTEMLSALGADIEKTDDGLIINGGKPLSGGVVSSCSDHRIAMSAATASVICQSEVTITSAEAAAKSYPTFWEDFAALGINLTKEN